MAVALKMGCTMYIVAGKRSPFGKFGRRLRNASLEAGIPADRTALSMNRHELGSAFDAVRDGTELGKTTEMGDLVRMGHFHVYCNMTLPQTADAVTAKFGVAKREADEYALRSQQRWKYGLTLKDQGQYSALAVHHLLDATMAVAVKKGVYIVAGKRTPFGKYGGMLRDVLPEDLFATAAKATLRAGDVAAELVDTVNIGQISSISSTGLSPRHASLKVGVPVDRPVLSMNKQSGSAFNAIICSAQEILLGAAQISLAGGMEVLSSVPFLVRDVRFGTELGQSTEMEDFLRMSYFDSYCNMHLLQTADIVAAKFGITRREADEFALKSQQKWKHADASGFFNEELVPVPVKLKNREVLMTRDEHPQPDTTFENLSKLSPVFHGGITTPGNATGINDGAAAMILVNDQALKDHNLKPLARIVGWSCVGVDPVMMGTAAVPAVKTLLNTTGLTIADMDLVEIHETYAATTLVCARELEVNEDKLNVNGGAIAIGHPSGASGARIMSHLTYDLRRRGLKRGIASASIAVGQGVAMIIETV